MQFVIVTGMSGAGKSTLLNIFEDIGYYCVDNLPPKLIHNLADFCLEGGSGIENVALGIDIRGGKRFNDLFDSLDFLEARHLPYDVLFLEANDEVLVKRFKETRRNHPLVRDRKAGDIGDAITEERGLLAPVKQRSTRIIETSLMLTRQLKEKIVEIYLDKKNFDLVIYVQSFGFKHGLPQLADLVFDVRCLPNPFYVPELKTLTGQDEPVRDFVMDSEVSKKFLRYLIEMIVFLIPEYIKEGKNQLVIAIGCTGGHHRSVTIARGLHDALQGVGYSAIISHRDITKVHGA